MSHAIAELDLARQVVAAHEKGWTEPLDHRFDGMHLALARAYLAVLSDRPVLSAVPAPHHHVKPFSAISDAQMADVVGWTIPRLNSRIQATKGFSISHNFGCEIVRLLTECQRRFEDTAPQVGQETDSAASLALSGGLDYERGLEDAAKIAEGITARTAHQTKLQYMTATTIAQAIRFLMDERYKNEITEEEQHFEWFLDNIEQFLENRQDVRDGSDGVPQPNEAMNLLRELREWRKP